MRLVKEALVSALLLVAVGCQAGDQLAQRAAMANVSYAYDKVEVARIDVPLLTADPRAELRLTLTVRNPIAATLDPLSYDVFIEGTKVGTGKTAETFTVPAGATSPLVLPISVPYANLPGAALQAVLNRRILLGVKGTSHVTTPVGTIDVPLEINQTVSL